MKKIITLALGCFLFLNSTRAQVKIGGTPVVPVPSAVLELDGGSSRGLLLPRMRKMDMDAIVDPAEGLTIYATDEQAVYLRKSLVWEKQAPFSLPYSGSIQLPTTAFDIFNFYDQNNGHAIYGYAKAGIGLYGNTSTGYAVSGSALNQAGIGGVFTHSNGGAALISNGKTGIGTLNPAVLLHINGTSYPGNTIIIDDDEDPAIQFRKAGINKSYIKQEGNNLVIRPNDQNSSGKVVLQSYNAGGWMFLDAAGNISLGQDPALFGGTPGNARMHIKTTGQNVLALEALNGSGGPILHFLEKTGNTTNSTTSLTSNSTAFTFNSTAQRYDWFGTGGLYGGNYAMTLRRSDQGAFYTYNLGVLGFIGSGTGFPEAPIHIKDALGANTSMIIDSYSSPFVSFKRSGSDRGFIQQLDNDMKIGTVATNDQGRFIIRTNGLDRLWVDSVGYVTIGGKTGPTINGLYKLAVKGKVAATEFNVVASGSWPDYVFADDYHLRSLEETEAFIKANKHLPGIPAASVVDKEGYGLGDMQKRMMEKIEELTLHLIAADKEIQLLKKQMAERK